jgi:hypothetical protein
MPHNGNPETIEARRGQILERPSTLTPTAAAALGRSRQIEENCASRGDRGDPFVLEKHNQRYRASMSARKLREPRFWLRLTIRNFCK